MAIINYNLSLTGDCQNNGNGSLLLITNGQSPPFTINWVEPISGATFSSQTITNNYYNVLGLSANSYSFYLSDALNKSTPEITFVITSSCTVNIGLIQNTTCGINNAAISATTDTNYGLNTINLYKDSELYKTTTTTTNNANFFNLPPGLYTAEVIDVGGCVGYSNTLLVNESTSLNFGYYVIDSPQCYSNSGRIFITGITGTPPYTYLWSNLPYFNSSDSATGLTYGNYGITVRDYYGCELSKVVNVGIGKQLSLLNYTLNTPTCFNADGSVTFYVSGGTPPYSYNLSTGEQKITLSDSITFDELTAGNYTLSVTDTGLCRFSQDFILVAKRSFTVLQTQIVNATCQELGKILITIQGGFPPYYYTLVSSGSPEVRQTSILNTTSYSNLYEGIYTLSIEDSIGSCVYEEEIEILNLSNFTLSVSAQDTTCGDFNGAITANVTTENTGLTFTYSLSNGTQSTPTTATTYTFSDLESGPYSVTVTDSDSCKDSQFAFVNTSRPYSITLIPTSAFNGDGGTISTLINETSGPFNLTWSDNVNGQTGYYITGLTAGTYSLTVSGENGCQQFVSTTVNDVISSSTTISFLYSSGSSVHTGGKSVSLQTMMYSGFTYTTQNAQNCALSSATFSLKVVIDTDEYVFPFYSTKSFNRIPTLTYFAPILENAILSIPYIETCVVNASNNTISITSQIVDGVQYYKDETITFDIIIYYNVNCLSINDVTCP
jgi:hypothetical protein